MIKGLEFLVKITELFCGGVQEDAEGTVLQLELVVCFLAGVLKGVPGEIPVKWIKSTNKNRNFLPLYPVFFSFNIFYGRNFRDVFPGLGRDLRNFCYNLRIINRLLRLRKITLRAYEIPPVIYGYFLVKYEEILKKSFRLSIAYERVVTFFFLAYLAPKR